MFILKYPLTNDDEYTIINREGYGGIGYLRESYIFASASSILARTTFGLVAQLVRVPDCRSGGCGFESRQGRYGLVAQLVRAGNS